MKAIAVFCAIVILTGAVDAGASTRADQASEQPVAEVDSTDSSGRASLKDREQLKKEMERIGLNEIEGASQWEREKSARTAVLLSALYPGIGQLYNGRKWKTVVFAGLGTVMLASSIVLYKDATRAQETRDTFAEGTAEWNFYNQLYVFNREDAISYLWYYGAVWFINLLDAYVDANLYDVREVKPNVTLTPGGGYLGATVSF